MEVSGHRGELQSAQTPQAATAYRDVAPDHYAAEHIGALRDAGMFAGTDCGVGLFCPNAPILRSKMAVWMVRILDDGGEPPPAAGNRFEDVDAEDEWASYIERFAELGVTAGCGDGSRYCGGEVTSRGQMATFLVRAFNLKAASAAGFVDTGGSTHAASIDALAAAGVTRGCATDPPRFCPSGVTSRAQMAAFIGRALDLRNPVLGAQLTMLVLDGANDRRDPADALVWDEELSTAAQAKAEAMANTLDWQHGFDFWSLLRSDWDIWRIGASFATDEDINDPRMAGEMGAVLVGERGAALLECAACTYLGTGVATANGWTYATVLVAGRIPEADLVAAETYMADLVNQLRESVGLRRLQYDPDIAAVARRWSRTMGTEWTLRHNSELGVQFPPGHFMAGENIATERYRGSLADAVHDAFAGLKASPGHYANMTRPGFTHQGIGVVLTANRVWITQNFAGYS